RYGADESLALRLSCNRPADRSSPSSARANVNAGHFLGAPQVDLDRRASRRRWVISWRLTTCLSHVSEDRRQAVDTDHIGAGVEAVYAVDATIVSHPVRIHLIHRGDATVWVAFGIAHSIG